MEVVQFHGWGDSNEYRASGGGATHIALVPGLLSSLENNKSDIIMVAGGRSDGAGTNVALYNTANGIGGNGGGTEGDNGVNTLYGEIENRSYSRRTWFGLGW